MAILYIHTNILNDKKYIGITRDSSAERRWGKDGIGYQNSYFYEKGISQFGWDGFNHQILIDDLSYDDVQQLEARLIKILQTNLPEYGYNEAPGVNIRPNSDLDILAETLIKKINSQKRNEDLILPTEYRYTTNHYEINYLVSLNAAGRINTDLDCQRGYTWTEERQQGMWDTLIFGHRIPEFHTIREGLYYDVIDGKQRITTILKIVNNEIPCKKSYASEKLLPLFEFLNKSSFLFTDLPTYLQERILNTSINVAEYTDIGDEEMVALFRKLNASMPLSDFSKGIADFILMRTNFTRFLIAHPALSTVYTENQRLASEDEKMLIRLAVLLKYGPAIDLTPSNLIKYYPDFTKKELLNMKDQIAIGLDRMTQHLPLLRGFRSIRSYLPLITYIVIEKKLSSEEINNFFIKIRAANYPGRGDDQHVSTVLNRYNTLTALL